MSPAAAGIHEPTPAQWQALFQAAVAVRDLAPWRWFRDTDLFAVAHPSLDEVGYCDVLGMGGEEFGLAVFLGSAGFTAYRHLMLEEVEAESIDTLSELRSLSATFVDRAFLDPRDHAVVRTLKLRFRGRGVWPWFRSQRPGYLPWYLEQDEAVFLTAALEQTVVVAERVVSGNLTLGDGLAAALLLTRCYREGTWHDEWRPAPPLEKPQEDAAPVDVSRVAPLRTNTTHSRETWLLDFVLLPTPIHPAGERPYLPLMLLATTTEGFVVGTTLLEPWASAMERQGAVLTLLEQARALPQRIRVGRAAVEGMLSPLASMLGIRVQLGDVTPLQEAQAAFLDYLDRQG